MPGPRADWNVGDLRLDEVDIGSPFDVPIEEIGEVIDLSDRKAVLNSRVQQLLAREEFLDKKGIRCAIKDHAETSCLGCPVSEARDLRSFLGSLCRVGREQEEVVTELVALRLRNGDDEKAV